MTLPFFEDFLREIKVSTESFVHSDPLGDFTSWWTTSSQEARKSPDESPRPRDQESDLTVKHVEADQQEEDLSAYEKFQPSNFVKKGREALESFHEWIQGLGEGLAGGSSQNIENPGPQLGQSIRRADVALTEKKPFTTDITSKSPLEALAQIVEDAKSQILLKFTQAEQEKIDEEDNWLQRVAENFQPLDLSVPQDMATSLMEMVKSDIFQNKTLADLVHEPLRDFTSAMKDSVDSVKSDLTELMNLGSDPGQLQALMRALPRLTHYIVRAQAESLGEVLIGKEFSVEELYQMHEALQKFDPALREALAQSEASPSRKKLLELAVDRNLGMLAVFLEFMLEADLKGGGHLVVEERHLRMIERVAIWPMDLVDTLKEAPAVEN